MSFVINEYLLMFYVMQHMKVLNLLRIVVVLTFY